MIKLKQKVKIKTVIYCGGYEEERIDNAIVDKIDGDMVFISIKRLDALTLLNVVDSYWVHKIDLV